MKTMTMAVWIGIAATFTGVASAHELSQLQLLPGDLAIGPAYYDQQSPAIARGGNIFLQRNGPKLGFALPLIDTFFQVLHRHVNS